jgi:hypothetical protein
MSTAEQAAARNGKVDAILKSGKFRHFGREFLCTGISVSNGWVAVKGQLMRGPIPMTWSGSVDEVELYEPGTERAAACCAKDRLVNS